MHKTFQYIDCTAFINLYKAFVHPVLEYGNIIWSPQYIIDQRSVEKVQRRAIKLIYGLYDMPYSDCPAALNLPSLQHHRFQSDMIALYQLLHKHFNIDTSELFTATTTAISQGHNLKLFKILATTRI